jgi:hypothetical protein
MRNAPEDALVGIGTARTATLEYSMTTATIRAEAEIVRQMCNMVEDMVRDYTAATEVDPSASLSFAENMTRAISMADLSGAMIVAENTDNNDGSYWVVVQLSKAEVVQQIRLAQAGAKQAAPAMSGFNAASMLDAAFNKAAMREIHPVTSY